MVREPEPVLELLEPMGHPNNKQRIGGLGRRDVPHSISWLQCSTSVIQNKQQFTSHDCGVACLYYAEMYGQNYSNDEISNTTQRDISEYRMALQEFLSQRV